jgi:hypothetical protein
MINNLKNSAESWPVSKKVTNMMAEHKKLK